LLRPFVGQQLRLPPVPTSWFHTTSPACSSSVLPALLQRLTILGFTVRFTTSRSWRIPAVLVLPFEAFPPPIAVVAWTCAPRGARRLRGEALTSCPAVTLPCCAATSSCTLGPGSAVVLQLPLPDPCSTVRAAHASRKFTSRLAASLFGLRGKLPSHLDREPRGFSPSSGPLRDRLFRLPCPVLPGAWAPLPRLLRPGGRARALGGVSTSKIGSFEPASRLLTVGLIEF
jgi:hypothetical protein